MPRLAFAVPHAVGRPEAKERLESALERVREARPGQLDDLTQQWNGDALQFAFSAMGLKMAGVMTVLEEEVQMNMDIPFAALMFKGRIESEMRQMLERLLRP